MEIDDDDAMPDNFALLAIVRLPVSLSLERSLRPSSANAHR